MSANPAPTSRSRGILATLAVCALLALLLFVLSRTGPDPAAANPLTGMAAVSAGRNHTCALTTAGGVKCWGWNRFGQLGDGTTIDRTVQVDVIGLTSGVAAVTAGWGHTCALTTAGGAKCWGSNGDGQLGAATTETCFGGGSPCSTTPIDVVGLTSGVAAVAAGDSHTCALNTAGGVKCWGYNGGGRLGDGTTTDRATPVDVVGLTSGAAAVTAGSTHTCALTTAGGVKCWGRNIEGQLGDGTTTGRTTPVDVVGLTSGAASVTAGLSHTCAVTTTGGLKCWGRNRGRLGDGTTTDSATPVDVVGLTSGVAVAAAGHGHTCAVTTAGGAKCWGGNSAGQLGDGAGGSSGDSSLTPVDVSGLTSGVAAVAAGMSHSCAVTTTGGLKCWGWNDLGQLGDGTSTSRLTPVDVVVELVKPTPTPTPCPAEGCPPPTPNPPGPAMELRLATSAEVGSKFTISVAGNLTPSVPISAFQFHIVTAAGVSYDGSNDCLSEAKVGRVDGGQLFTCMSLAIEGGHYIGLLSESAPPRRELDVPTDAKVVLANLSYRCDTVGEKKITLTRASINNQIGAIFGDTNSAAIPVQAETQDGVNVADSATIICGQHVQFSASTYSVAEYAGTFEVTVTRLDGSDGVAVVDLKISDGTAQAGSDYTALSIQSLTWLDGDAADKTATITLINDGDKEGSETVNLELNNAQGTTLGSPAQATLIIVDDEAPVGGIAELPEVADTQLEAPVSSGSSTGLLASLAGAVAAGAVALGGAAWYARRRWAR